MLMGLTQMYILPNFGEVYVRRKKKKHRNEGWEGGGGRRYLKKNIFLERAIKILHKNLQHINTLLN
jgi:hypothetical protein